MSRFLKNFSAAILCGHFFLFGACAPQPQNNTQPAQTKTNVGATPAPAATPQMTDQPPASNLPVTLPVLDAMFADEAFAADLKAKLNLTDEQIEKLRTAAGEAVNDLDAAETEGSTAAAARRAEEQIRAIVGEQKTPELLNYVRQRWASSDGLAALPADKPNAVPTDTRIVVNAPAYRMDVFRDGQLVKTYKIGIGYPEFPLPTGMRQAKEIIFNPTWTPPDEPWVKGKYKPFKKVEAGSKLNPLGLIKIPIGLPSLIHGGKDVARLGTFASHGCVGLTNAQVQDFALALAQISATSLTPADVAGYEKQKTETKNVRLANPIPVELRYETIVVQDGRLHIYRDVYERGTNTEENLRKVLEVYEVSFDSLSETEKTQIIKALQQMARDAQGNPAEANANTKNQSNKNAANSSGKVTRNIKGQKEVVVEIAALKGKGYPAPVNLNAGDKSKTGLNSGQGNSNTKPAVSPANSQSRRF